MTDLPSVGNQIDVQWIDPLLRQNVSQQRVSHTSAHIGRYDPQAPECSSHVRVDTHSQLVDVQSIEMPSFCIKT